MFKEFVVSKTTTWEDLIGFVGKHSSKEFLIDWYNSYEVTMVVRGDILLIEIGPVEVKFSKEDFSVTWDSVLGYYQVVLKNDVSEIFMFNLSVVDRDFTVEEEILVESTEDVCDYDRDELEGCLENCEPLENGHFLKSYVYYDEGEPGRILRFLMEKEENVNIWLRTTETKHRLK